MLPAAAHAQGTLDATRAQELFDEGRKLMAEQRYAEACERFAQSDRAQPTGSALANLGDCLERRGLTASAWRRFREAQARASKEGRADVQAYLGERIARLEPELARLTILMADDASPGEKVTIDGAEIGRDDFGGAPVDPGLHQIVASAPGKRSFEQAVEVRSGTEHVTVAIPVLQPLADPIPATLATPASSRPGEVPANGPDSTWPAQRTWAIVAGAAGLAAIGTGVGLGFEAKGIYDASLRPSGQDAQCSVGGACTPRGEEQQKNAQSLAGVGTAVFVGGTLLVGAAVVIYLTSPSSAPGAGATLRLEPTAGGAALRGTW
jgi:hypothetical protein